MRPIEKGAPIGAILLIGIVFLYGENRLAQASQTGENSPVAYEPSGSKGGQRKESEIFFNLFSIFNVKASYNESKFSDRLRLNKAHVKYSIYSDLLTKRETQEPVPLFTAKTWQATELKRCDKGMNFHQPDVEADLDCKPFEVHLQDEDAPSANPSTGGQGQGRSLVDPVLYVKRYTIRNKMKQFTFHDEEIKSKNEWHLYPLRHDTTRATIDYHASEHISGGLGFGPDRLDLGFYYEINITNKLDPLLCTGQMFISINASQPFFRFPDGMPQFSDYFAYLIGEAPEGFFIHLKEATCGRVSEMTDSNGIFEGLIDYKFKIENDFTLIRRSTFPYWSCRHHATAPKLMGITVLDYLGTLNQTRHHETDEAYNTTISIDSNSDWHQWGKFKLEQSFVNDNYLKGFEEMILAYPELAAVVKGEWSPETFTKKLKLFQMDPVNYQLIREFPNGKLVPAAEIGFRNKEDESFVTLEFKFQKDFFQMFHGIHEQAQDNGLPKPTASDIIDELRREDAAAELKAEQLRKAHEEL